MKRHVVIMAGGAGKRLWPASCSKKPKQMLELDHGKSLLLSSLERALAMKIDGEILIVTHQTQIRECIAICSTLSEADKSRIVILGEPEARNTAPALALAAQWIDLFHSPEDAFLVMAADHLITPLDNFILHAMRAFETAEKHFLVTFGIKPDHPSTGYGYIESETREKAVRKVLSFKEKPDLVQAEEFLQKGNYFWNSGMFAFRSDHFFSEMKEHTSEIAALFQQLNREDFSIVEEEKVRFSSKESSFSRIYEQSPSISIDYAIMEKSSNIRMVSSDFDWNDVGSWDSIADHRLTEDSLVFGNSGNNYIYSDIPVAIKGVKNLIVVVKNGQLMICPRGESQLVKELVEEIQEKGHQELL